MPTLYLYICHNPRCPHRQQTKELFQWRAVPTIQTGNAQSHFHCPHCRSGTDTHLEAIAQKRVHKHEMSAYQKQK